ncbi:ATPase [gamma proteobacterium NOR5-3]|nr:ATPase [gamma proteobacterium NOR5-3]
MLTLDPSLPAQGAAVDIARLLALRFPARQLDIRRRRRALAQLSGGQRSNFRGRGIEFEEVRGYQPGDDIRAIDWRVTARTGSAHTKMFHEERERPVLLVVDQRSSMHFGSQNCFKLVLAAEIAALLAWSALASNERVGGLLMRDTDHWEMRPRNSRRTVLALLSALAEAPESGAASTDEPDHNRFSTLLRSVRRVARPGSSIFLISDFDGAEQADAQEELFQLARHVEITAIHCSDPLEAQLPPAGRYSVTDGQARADLDTGIFGLSQRFAELYTARVDGYQQQLQRLGIPMLSANTTQAPLTLLRNIYGGAAGPNKGTISTTVKHGT